MVSGGVVDQFASEEWPLRAGLMSCPAYYSHLICDSSHPHYCPQCTMLGLVRGRVIYYLEAKIINYKLSGHKHCTIKIKVCINILYMQTEHVSGHQLVNVVNDSTAVSPPWRPRWPGAMLSSPPWSPPRATPPPHHHTSRWCCGTDCQHLLWYRE